MEFEKACSEVDYILDNLDAEYKKNIPSEVINAFKYNKDMFYKVNIDMSKPLDEQNLLEETRAFLYILKTDYFSGEDDRTEAIQSNEKQDVEKFDNKNETQEISAGKEMVVYNRNPFINIINKIKEFFKRFQK